MNPRFRLTWLIIFAISAGYNLNVCGDHFLSNPCLYTQLQEANCIEVSAFELWNAVQLNSRSNLGTAVNRVLELVGRDRLRTYITSTSNSVLVQNKQCPAYLFCASLWKQAQSQLSTEIAADYDEQQDPLLWQIIKTPHAYCTLYLLGLHQPSPRNTNLKTRTVYWHRLQALIQEEVAGHEPGGVVFSSIVSAEIKRLVPTQGITLLMKQVDDAVDDLDVKDEKDTLVSFLHLSPEHRQLYLRKQALLRLQAALREAFLSLNGL